MLKGKKVSITESLTKQRVAILQKAREELGFTKVWSQDGRILNVNKDGEVDVYYE